MDEITSSTELNRWAWISKFWAALAQKGGPQQPFGVRTAAIWASGVIGSLTTTTLTDSSKEWAPDWWIGSNPPVPPYPEGSHYPANTPHNHDLIIYDVGTGAWPDFRRIQRVRISGNSSTTLSFVERDWWNPSQYVGYFYAIVTADEPWVQECCPWGPNDRPLEPPSYPYTPSHATGGSSTTLVDAKQNWTINQFAGQHVVVKQTISGRLRSRRALVTANTATTLSFASQSWSVSANDPYVIVAPASVYAFDRTPGPLNQWTGSPCESWYCRNPENGSVSLTSLPYLTTQVQRGDATFTIDVWDTMAWTEIGDEYEAPDHCRTPHFPAHLRGLQRCCELICGNYVDPAADLSGHNAIDPWTIATYYQSCGLKTASVSISAWNGTDTITFGATGDQVSEDSPSCYWTVLDGQKVVTSGGPTNITPTQTTLGIGTLPSGTNPVGMTLLVGYGWTRKVPRRVGRVYDQLIWIPDKNGEVTVDPPTLDFPGTWTAVPKHTHYLSTNELGQVQQSSDSHDVFTTNDLAYYVGDNHNDPGLHLRGDLDPMELDRTSDPNGGGSVPRLTIIRAAQAVCRRQNTDKFGDSGTITAACVIDPGSGPTTYWIEDSTKDWWRDGVLIEHGPYTLQDFSGFAEAIPTDPDGWFALDGRWVGAEIEVVASGDTSVVTYHGGGTVQFSPLPSFASGTFTIREAKYEQNRWAGRYLRLTQPDGTVMPDIPITGNCRKRIAFEPVTYAVSAGWKYQIVESATGTTWAWNGTKWVAPDPEIYGHDQTKINPTVVTRYGKVHKGDIVIGKTLHDELGGVVGDGTDGAINMFRHSKAPASWTVFKNDDSLPVWSEPNLGYIGQPETLDNTITLYRLSGYADGALVGYQLQVRSLFDPGPACTSYHVFTITSNSGISLTVDGTLPYAYSAYIIRPATTGAAAREINVNYHDIPGMIWPAPPDWATALANGQGAFGSPGLPGVGYYQGLDSQDGTAPYAATEGLYRSGGGANFVAACVRSTSYCKATIPYQSWRGTSFSVAIDYYAYATTYLGSSEDTFNANGDGLYNKGWKKWATTTSRTDGQATYSPVKLGSLSCPAAPASAPSVDNQTMAAGYKVVDQCVVIKWETMAGWLVL